MQMIWHNDKPRYAVLLSFQMIKPLIYQVIAFLFHVAMASIHNW